MANPFFKFRQFTIYHDRCAMKVTTDACLFGAWCAAEINSEFLRKKFSALDIGTGTGLLSLMLAQKAATQIDAIEIEGAAAMQAKENVLASPWKERINILHGDVLKINRDKKYDVIISNPPFYEKEIESASGNKNKAHHGHSLRLEDLLPFIREGLAPEGKFFLLLPHKRSTEIKTLFRKTDLFIEKEVIMRQSVNHAAFRLMLKGTRKETVSQSSELSIKDERDQYTKDFIQLLRDYYLYL